MFKTLRVTMLSAALSLFVAFGGGATVFAAGTSTTSNNAGSVNGYKISPVRTDLTVQQGTSQSVTFYVQNISSATENLQVLINDFTARNDNSGAPAILVNGTKAPSHGLANYITVSPATATLQPGEQKQFSALVSIPNGISAGGYFGAIRVAPQGATTGKNVNLSASVASLILVRVPGNYKEQMAVSSFQVTSGDSPHTFFTNDRNLNVSVVLNNAGDVQEEPFGKIQLKKGSKLVKAYEINNTDPRGNVLPDSSRKFTVALQKVGSFGKYTAEGNFGYGDNGQVLTARTTFYIVPLPAIVAVIGIVAILLILAVTVPRVMRRHDRNVLRKAGRR